MTASTTRPATIVLVHGSWHGSWCWQRVKALLVARGLAVKTVDLPSCGDDPYLLGDLLADVAVVRKVLDESQDPAVVCGHSYGGTVITEAAWGYDRVRHLVYISAFMQDLRESFSEIAGDAPPPWLELRKNGTSLPRRDLAPTIFYGDCDPATQAWASQFLRPQSLAASARAPSSTAWRTTPSTYAICANDLVLPPDFQRTLSRRADSAVEFPTSHSPFLSRPYLVADLLHSVAIK